MADDRYGGHDRREGWRERGTSIFSDDDDRYGRATERWSGASGSRGRDEGRGFFERAADEVRSWIGDEEAERRREMDARRDEGRDPYGGRGYESRSGIVGSRTPYGGYGFDYGRGMREPTDRGGRGDWDRDTGRDDDRGGGWHGGRSQWDANYRQWRDQQIARFDREYEEYCRERQQQFDRDFDSWRTSRLTEGGTDAAGYGAGSSRAGTGGTTRSTGAHTSPETTGGGTRGGSRSGGSRASGTADVSGGSATGAAGAALGATAATETGSRGRGGRSRG